MDVKCQPQSDTLHWRLPVLPEGAPLLKKLFSIATAACFASFLQACATTPPVDTAAATPPPGKESKPAAAMKTATEAKPVPELTLHLPEPKSADCDCSEQNKAPPTFLEKGFARLAARDYREAVNYFRRYQRLESAPAADWEASIAVAYVKMIPESPYYNWRAARDSYLRLMREQPTGVTLHEQVVLYRDTLAILIDLHTRINDLQSERSALAETLEKREEALRRLRELTLGQKAAGS